MHLILDIIIIGMINVLNKSIMTHGFTSWSVSVMISSLKDYRQLHLNHVGNLSLSRFTICAAEIIHQK